MRMQMIVTHNTNPRGNWQELVDRQPCGQLPGSVFNLTPRTLSLSHSNTHVCLGYTVFGQILSIRVLGISAVERKFNTKSGFVMKHKLTNTYKQNDENQNISEIVSD